MDKETLSNYGWIVICVLVLAVMIALATPFGDFVANAVKSTTQGLFDVNQGALNVAGIKIDDNSFAEAGATQTKTIAATFNDGATLTWEELKLTENGEKYGYNNTKITDAAIGNKTFWECATLTNIDIPDSVITIDTNAFYNCTALTTATLGSGITTIGQYAFRDCANLTTVNVPNGVTSIGSDAFYGCSSLTDIKIPKGVTTIADKTFQNCTSLESITLTEGLTNIGSYTFSKCSALESITIPASVTNIDTYAFNNCSILNRITFEGTTAQWTNSVTLGEYWNRNVPATEVKCSDGTVSLS